MPPPIDRVEPSQNSNQNKKERNPKDFKLDKKKVMKQKKMLENNNQGITSKQDSTNVQKGKKENESEITGKGETIDIRV